MNPNSTFIKIEIEETKKLTLAYIDSGATLCIAQEKMLSKETWKKLPKPTKITVADKSQHELKYAAFLVKKK